jgi:predicted exporter
MRVLAAVWLATVLLCGLYLGYRIHQGALFRTDLTALLPQDERNPVLQQASDTVSKALSRRVIFMVGHGDREVARSAAAQFSAELLARGVVGRFDSQFDAERVVRLGRQYFPYREGLLSERHRAMLQDGQGERLAIGALSQVFGFVGMADAALLRQDPFLLLPGFIADLPFPTSRLIVDDGYLTVVDGGVTWIALTGLIAGESMALDTQQQLIDTVAAAEARLKAVAPTIELRRLGVVFFGHAGASLALDEASWLGSLSLLGTVLLIVVVFRRIGPLLHNLLALAVGTTVALSVSFLIFEELHVAILLFGISLIGVAVDYGLHYSASLFDPAMQRPAERLAHVRTAITLGLLTTLIGYAALLLAPFPGLHQLAVFAIVGLIAAFLTVILWIPVLDRDRSLRHGTVMLNAAAGLWRFWSTPRLRPLQYALLVLLVMMGVLGWLRLEVDDDVRHMQALSPALLKEQADIQHLTGAVPSSQFLLIRAADDEAALQREETIMPALEALKTHGQIASYQAPASYVPSAARQQENARLRAARLDGPLRETQYTRLGLPAPEQIAGAQGSLTLAEALQRDAIPYLKDLVVAPGLHTITLHGLKDAEALRAAFAGMPDLWVVDPVTDFNALLGRYRDRAVMLIAISAVLMLVPLIWRYGLRGALRVMAPPAMALVLTPAALALLGQKFTFFHAMAMILVLSISVDYAIFCAEGDAGHHSIIMLAIWLVTFTTLLSFGMLAFSEVAIVQGFGLTMLVGMCISLFLAPLARRPAERST